MGEGEEEGVSRESSRYRLGVETRGGITYP